MREAAAPSTLEESSVAEMNVATFLPKHPEATVKLPASIGLTVGVQLLRKRGNSVLHPWPSETSGEKTVDPFFSQEEGAVSTVMLGELYREKSILEPASDP
ncbi:unnamed protein product [Rangifer tarandus platyrhynchus]|uniref:Uncharacterized protein n=2 Tax=Rangifer tarandus platyrhynchus TaxID=3082113 RepID=A0ABN8YFI0_RANTA|nr:unnamed protein product [Rangifer tarandus platyrhynchus]CAI9699683.1 unnamed protein product [Rangifer tarandus platyrhynchus]